MKQNEKPLGLRLVKSDVETHLAGEAFARLEQGRALLVRAGHDETVRLLDIVLLQLRSTMHGISVGDLKALCDALMEPATADDQLRGA